MTNEELEKLVDNLEKELAKRMLEKTKMYNYIVELEAQVHHLTQEDEARRHFAKNYPEYAFTWDLAEHPAGWEFPCMCENCRSYGD